MLDLSSREVKRFHRAALMHLAAAEVLLAACDRATASALATEAVYLSGYVAECALKALLLSRTPRDRRAGVEAEFRSALGHNFDWLKHRLQLAGLTLPRGQTENLSRVRTEWEPGLRYDPAAYRPEDADRVLRAAEGLLGWASGG